MKRGQRGRFGLGESQADEALPAALVHVVNELHDASRSLPQRLVLPGPGRHQHQRVEHFVVEAGRVAQRVVAPTDRVGQARAEIGLARQVLLRCARPNATCRASSCAASRATAAVTGSGAYRSMNQSSERNVPFAEHRQQERRDREVRLVDQRLERRLAAGRREAELAALEHARAA